MLVASQLSGRACQQEVASQQLAGSKPPGSVPPATTAEAQLRKC